MNLSLVAIMKNEMPYISEWVAHHLSIGFDSITVYDNESSDGTSALLDKLSTFLPINRIHWAVEEGSSPQLTAYNHACYRLLVQHILRSLMQMSF